LATDVGWAKTVKLELAVAPDRQSVAVNLPVVNNPPQIASDLTVRAGRSKWNSWSTGPEGRPGQFEDGYV
jgi:hypothetical protein